MSVGGMDVIIRPAVVGDCLEIEKLIKELAEYEKMGDEPKLTHKDLERNGFGSSKRFRCIVAEAHAAGQDKKLVGYALFHDSYSAWIGPTLFLENLYVNQDFRGHKIGLRLFQALAKIAVEENCHQINFFVSSWNEPSIQFYKKTGASNFTETKNRHSFQISDGIQELAALEF